MVRVSRELLNDLNKRLAESGRAWQKAHPTMSGTSIAIRATIRSENPPEISATSGYTRRKRQWRLERTELETEDYSNLELLLKANPKPWMHKAIKHLSEVRNRPTEPKEIFPGSNGYTSREAINSWLKTQGSCYRLIEVRRGAGILIQLGFGR